MSTTAHHHTLELSAKGSKLIVLGGSCGIGLSVARNICDRGGKVIPIAESANKLNDAISAFSTDDIGFSADQAHPGQVRERSKRLPAEH